MLHTRKCLYMQCRLKSGKQRWSVLERKKTPTGRALENFDDFYGSVYGLRWRNMRAALLSEKKYIALVNNFGDTEKTCKLLESDGAINLKLLINLAKNSLVANKSSLPEKHPYEVGERLEQIVKKHEEQESRSIYPEESFENKSNPFNLIKNINEAENNIKTEEKTNKIDTEIDSRRVINTKLNTGAQYEFIPATKIKGMENWIPESDYYKYYNTTCDFPLNIEMEPDFIFPENLFIYAYEMGNCSDFQTPKRCTANVFSHYLMDGASILPPLLLDVRHGESVLDACAAPGGKSLLMLQTLCPGNLVCNDIQESRINRVRKLMQEFLFDFKEIWEGKRLVFSQMDARNISDYGTFDKILVDVPCTTDRHSLKENDNNIFKPTRIKERLRIPELQASILTNCLRLLRPGGSLVYATCSLSPVQNDGVVHMALQRAFTNFNITTTVKDLSIPVQMFRDIFKFENPKGLKYGQMVVPYLPANFGPMYLSKITRNIQDC